jgi:hypothetical protein
MHLAVRVIYADKSSSMSVLSAMTISDFISLVSLSSPCDVLAGYPPQPLLHSDEPIGSKLQNNDTVRVRATSVPQSPPPSEGKAKKKASDPVSKSVRSALRKEVEENKRRAMEGRAATSVDNRDAVEESVARAVALSTSSSVQPQRERSAVATLSSVRVGRQKQSARKRIKMVTLSSEEDVVAGR